MTRTLLCFFVCGMGMFIWSCSATDTPSSPVESSADSYYPLTKGSVWKYSGTYGDYTQTIVGDSVDSGKTYRKIEMLYLPSQAVAYRLARKEADTIYTVLPDYRGLPADIIKIMENISVGSMWTYYTIQTTGAPYPIMYSYTVTSMGNSRTVLSKDYSNVAEVAVKLYVDIGGTGYRFYGSGTDYYAKGTGLIESNLATEGGSIMITLSSSSVK